jgi:hypothetical protein
MAMKYDSDLKTGLNRALAAGEVVRLIRKPHRKLERVTGFVVGVSDSLVLLHEMHPDWFSLNGYQCVRLRDVKYGEAVGGPDEFIGRAVLLRGLEPKAPGSIDLSSMRSLLQSAARRYPLVAVHSEISRPDVCYIGKVIKVGKRKLWMRTVETDASWGSTDRFRLDDISLVEFDSGYERMLWQVNQAFHETLLAETSDAATV